MSRTRIHRRAQRGVSLLEALVAMGVMAFGMLGIVGVQSTLRLNADVAKQRSEAVRLAELAIEDARTFTLIEATDGLYDYTDLANASTGSAYTDGTTNTTYTTNLAVIASGDTPDSPDPRFKRLRVTVSWADRSGSNQSVQMDTAIAKVMPELSGTLALATAVGTYGVTQRGPAGRNLAIPVSAVDQGDGTSNFAPPGSTGVTWVFNNTTGLITIRNNAACGGGTCMLLSGTVFFATGGDPTSPPGQSEAPNNIAVPVSVSVIQSVPNAPPLVTRSNQTVNCYIQTLAPYAYFCALKPSDPYASPTSWTGQSLLTLANLSTTLADATVTNYKVCRYTPDRGLVNGVELGDVPKAGNVAHPLNYTNVIGALLSQDFLVISAGDGTSPYACPADDPSTPYVNGNTWQHQPHS